MEACQFDGGDCCQKSLIGNGICEEANNFASCGNFDGGDCKEAEKEYPSNEYEDDSDEELLSEFVEYAFNDPCKFTKCELNSKCVNDKGIIKCVELCDLVKCGLNQKCVATNATPTTATTTPTTTTTTTTHKPRKPKRVQTN